MRLGVEIRLTSLVFSQQLVPLTPIPGSVLEKDPAMDFLGPMLPDDEAVAIAEGDMDPITMEKFPIVPVSNVRETAPKVYSRAPSSAPSRSLAFQGWVVPAPTRQETRKLPPSFAAAPQQQNQPSQPHGRRFPSSFAHKPESKPSSIIDMMRAQASAAPSRPVESSPSIVSRFFASQPKQTSPLDEAEKCLDEMPPSSSSSMYESQDPVEVDVSRSISFSPVEEKTQVRTTTSGNKENFTPPRATMPSERETASPPPAVKENAFSRMMRAGSALQKHSLKRKAASSSFRHVKKLQGMVDHHDHQLHGRSTEQRVQQFAHVASPKSKAQARATIRELPTPAVAQSTVTSLDRFRFTK